jgi:inhibitor of KinA
MQTTHRWRFDPLGEAALLATCAETDMDAANRAALALAEAITRARLPGVGAVVPAIDSVLVSFDPLHISRAELEGVLRTLTAIPPAAESAGRVVVIAARFGGEDGPDLAELAAGQSCDSDAIITALCARPYRVLMIGFAPGYPYIGPLPSLLNVPRRATPRAAVPAGSVAIAAGMAGIYPARLPGGWHLIGRTTAKLFDPARAEPSLLRAGDLAQFKPI